MPYQTENPPNRPKPLTAGEIASFFEARSNQKPVRLPGIERGMEDDLDWEKVAVFLNALEKKHPWKVRRVRASLAWLFHRAHQISLGREEL